MAAPTVVSTPPQIEPGTPIKLKRKARRLPVSLCTAVTARIANSAKKPTTVACVQSGLGTSVKAKRMGVRHRHRFGARAQPCDGQL